MYLQFILQNYIQKLWSALQDPENPLIDVLSKFYNELLSKWTVELNWCNEVFSSPLMMLGSLFGESLNSLSPPLNHCLHSDVHRSQTPILTLINLRNVRPAEKILCNEFCFLY